MQAFRNILPIVVAAVALAVAAPFGWAEDAPRAKKPPADVERMLTDAAKAEADGKYEEALRHYLRAFTAGRTDPDTRDHIRICLRHVAQAERHRDPAFQKFVAAMPATDALTLYGEVVGEIHKKYADRTKATVERLFAAGLDELIAALDVPAFREQHLKDADDAKIAEFRALLRDTKLPTTPREATQAARAVVAAANKTLGLKGGAAVVFELMCGACTGLDEYSSYVPPGGADPSPLAELAGYGLLVKADGQGLLVEAVQPRSWAAAMTKLRKGDRIRKVNGKSVVGATPAAIAEALRAMEGNGHVIEVALADDGVGSVNLPTPVPTVYAAELIDMKEGVGYLRLAAFKDRTPQEFDDAVMELKARGMKALVIDIRGNSGGLFAAAVGIAKRLLPGGPVATTDGQVPDFASRVFSSDSGMAAHDFPVVLLIDTKTMSAAEILAASLKDNQRAVLVGLPTFGKGLIQAGLRLHSLDGTGDDRGAKSGLLILSVGMASGPLSGLIQGRGVTPHVAEADADRQLTLAVEKAMELLAGGPVMPPMPPMPPESTMPPLVRR
jgi:carboxyl-terminal processing protease